MQVFQAELVGFDGGTDGTDHLIKWIQAPSLDLALDACANRGWEVSHIDVTDLDLGCAGIDLFVEAI